MRKKPTSDNVKRRFTRFLVRARQRGAGTLVEYTVIISIVSIAAVVLLKAIGTRTNTLLEMTNSNMPK